MEISEEINDLRANSIKGKEDGVIGQTTVALSSCDNADSAPTSGGNTNERVERKKKTRRGKPKGKNYKPYNKAPKDVDMKMKRSRQRVNSRLTYDQPEAPNNSNQFIIEDHNFHQIPIDSPERPNQRKCYRDSSFTSVESDGENFYSSPEDEVDYIIQDFSATYKNLREETLSGMSKNDLIRQVLSLEEKIETLVKKKKGTEDDLEGVDQDVFPTDKLKTLEYENSWLKKEVDRLTTENSTLRRRCKSSESSIDSESDSSSSSSSSSDSSTSSSKPNSPGPVLVNGAAKEDDSAVVTNMEEDLVEMNIAVIQSNDTGDKLDESNGTGEIPVPNTDNSGKSANDNV